MLHILRTAARRYLTTPIATNPPKKVGGFRGGFLGFLVGVTLTGGASYYYLMDEYKAANKAIVADVLSLEKTIRGLEEHVRALEKKVGK